MERSGDQTYAGDGNECISADGRCLIIWPTSTLRGDWTTHPTPNWNFSCFSSGYSNSHIILEWFHQVFDPQTESRANGRPRLLIMDGFGAHESLKALQSCHENNRFRSAGVHRSGCGHWSQTADSCHVLWDLGLSRWHSDLHSVRVAVRLRLGAAQWPNRLKILVNQDVCMQGTLETVPFMGIFLITHVNGEVSNLYRGKWRPTDVMMKNITPIK